MNLCPATYLGLKCPFHPSVPPCKLHRKHAASIISDVNMQCQAAIQAVQAGRSRQQSRQSRRAGLGSNPFALSVRFWCGFDATRIYVRLSTGTFQTLPFRLSWYPQVCYDSLCKRMNFSSPIPCNHDYRQLWACLCTDCGSICG